MRLASESDSGPVLRSFEKGLLKELGYAMTLERDSATGRTIDPARTYAYDPERGPIEVDGTGSEPRVSGQALLDIARDDYTDPATQQQAKLLMRALINHRLEYRPLRSREIFRELQQL
jgi:DNA repair protein RecO (recombination protein O)